MEPQALLGIALSLATAVLYVHVGRIMLQRDVEAPSRRALQLFAVWWFALAGLSLMGAAELGLLVLGVFAIEVYIALIFVSLLLLVLSLWGLLYYLLYLHTGSERLLVPLTIFYAGLYAAFAYVAMWLQPIDVELRHLRVKIVYANTLDPLATALVLGSMLGPVTLAALLYGSLLFRLTDRLHRFRVALVSGSFFLWFGLVPLIGTLAQLNHAPWWPMMGRVMGLVVPGLILIAYRPPNRLREWLDAGSAASE